MYTWLITHKTAPDENERFESAYTRESEDLIRAKAYEFLNDVFTDPSEWTVTAILKTGKEV
jgi:hypothetical protein|tara:strand:+ start:6048 stop:6230 length:183 start_codon:yes stop_codon:yes gene_type:complete